MDVKYGFTPLTKTGVPNRLPEFLTDEQLYSINKERFNFYQQLLDELSNQGTRIPDAVFGIANRNRYIIQKLRDDMSSLANSIAVLKSRVKVNNGITDPEDLQKMLDRLNAQLGSNVFLKGYEFTKAPGASVGGDGLVDSLKEEFPGQDADADKLAKFRIIYENDPILAPSVDEITSTDRVIFIAVTFLFRGISLFLTEWAMNSYMFSGFHAAITWYCGVYISLILLLALLVNASKNIQLFRMMFYYLSAIPHGYGRLILHCIVLLMLLPIPFLVRENITGVSNEETEDYSFARRRAIMRVLSNLTFFIWVLTSVIAARF
jgi:hypothetical protein